MVTENDFRPTSLNRVNHHFLCKMCKNLVWNPRQCANLNCQVLYCSGCCKQGVIRCPSCNQNNRPVDINIKLKNFMDMLKINCPGCKNGFIYSQLCKHMEECDGCKTIKKEGRKAEALPQDNAGGF